MTELYLETINEKFKTCFSSHFTGMMLECCVVCLNSQNHKTGVFLKKEPYKSNLVEPDFILSWQLELTDVFAKIRILMLIEQPIMGQCACLFCWQILFWQKKVFGSLQEVDKELIFG